MFKEISIEEELPPIGKFVTTIDEAGQQRVHRMNEDGTWFMRDANGTNSPNNNLLITHWLKEGNQYLLQFHLSRRSDEGWGRLRLVFASSLEEAEKILDEKVTYHYTDALASEMIHPDTIKCLNI